MSGTFDLAAYEVALGKLMPPGRAWSGRTLNNLVAALAQNFADSDANAVDLIKDAFPSTAYNLLTEWESTLALPDTCANDVVDSVAYRRAAVVKKLVGVGGQSMAYYTDLAKNFGFNISITQHAPSKFGQTFGNTFGGQDWAFAWTVTTPDFATVSSQINQSFGLTFGQPFGGLFAQAFTQSLITPTNVNQMLACLIGSAAPAHTIVLYQFGA